MGWWIGCRGTVIPESEDWKCGFDPFTAVQIQTRNRNRLGLFLQFSGKVVKDEDFGVRLPQSKVQISHLTTSDTELVTQNSLGLKDLHWRIRVKTVLTSQD